MLLSSCVIWRFREWDDFRAECPTGDERLQRVVWERLDDGIAWLESLGAPVVKHETGNPRTVGKRFHPRGTDRGSRAARSAMSGSARQTDSPAVLATGGFQGDPTWLRNTSSQLGVAAAARESVECGRRAGVTGSGMARSCRPAWTSSTAATCPTPTTRRSKFVPLAQLYGRLARVFNDRGEEFFEGARSPGRRTTSSRPPRDSPARGRGTCSTTGH